MARPYTPHTRNASTSLARKEDVDLAGVSGVAEASRSAEAFEAQREGA